MMFSDLACDFIGTKHPLYELLDQLKSQGETVIDLVRGNVTEHGITFPQAIVRQALTDSIEATGVYQPDPFGQLIARQSIANYYTDHHLTAQQVLLTPGTSMSYWYCFKLLAEPGDEILAPVPTYPLLDHIARLCGVTLSGYRLDESRGWAIDITHLESRINSKTRAIVLISPHNPTGMVCSAVDISQVADLAKRYDLPIIFDEVFSEFVFSDSTKKQETFARPIGSAANLVLTLNGLSKSLALPGMKLGWIAVSGDKFLVNCALDVLETISDTFLPVNEIAQFSLPPFLANAAEFLQQYRSRVCSLRAIALAELEGIKFAPPQGGFYITLPIECDEEQAAISLLRHEHILVHPGHFYDIDDNHLVFTFIQDPEELRRCVNRIRAVVKCESQLGERINH